MQETKFNNDQRTFVFKALAKSPQFREVYEEIQTNEELATALVYFGANKIDVVRLFGNPYPDMQYLINSMKSRRAEV